ncbi:MAG TPA: hypothetical protein VGQ79_06975 [Nitrospiraceae bacterium]|jgi:hypothetical protein|nr:hypothetical protein [Nitrospiraceae bacterium]
MEGVSGRLFSAGVARPRPTQLCTFEGSRSMLQYMLDRVDQLIQLEHKVTVII